MATVETQQVKNYGMAPRGWDECAICLDIRDEELRGHNATDRVIHKYHKSCMNQWLQSNMSCPECRVPLESREISQIQNPLVQLELAVPQLVQTPKAYFQKIADNLPLTAGLSSTFVVGEFLGRGIVPLNPLVMCLGAGIGFVASRVVRNYLGEAPVRGPENELQRMGNICKSRSFMGAIATAGAIGVLGVTGTALTSTIPIVLGGMALHYGIEKLEENELINEEAKSTLQKATAIFSMAYGMMSPLRSLVSIGLGAAFGAVLENQSAPPRVEQADA